MDDRHGSSDAITQLGAIVTGARGLTALPLSVRRGGNVARDIDGRDRRRSWLGVSLKRGLASGGHECGGKTEKTCAVDVVALALEICLSLI